jgi:anti-sigma regulatory factor (Ser/Thr protein kinase)
MIIVATSNQPGNGNPVLRDPAFAGSRAMLQVALRWVPVRPMLSDLVLQLPASTSSARAARRAVAGLPLNGHEQALNDLRLLVTELVTNSIRHAQLSPTDTIRLTVALRQTIIRVEVADDGPGFTRPALDAPPTGTGGRGLYLVDILADRWGAEPTLGRDGWRVWFEIDLC